MKSLMIRNEVEPFDLKVCDVQGRLFELASEAGYDSRKFIETFMKSEIASHLDMNYSFYQWSGEEYMLAELEETEKGHLIGQGRCYDKETMYWIGFIYRFWHYYTGESSKAILRKTPAQLAERNYLMLHTMAPEIAVESFKEMCV